MAGTNPSDPLKKENGVNVLVLTQGMVLILYGTEKIAIEQWHDIAFSWERYYICEQYSSSLSGF